MAVDDALIERLNYVLLSCYVVIALLSLIQLVRMRYNRHSLKSFQAGFLALCLFWTLMRSLFWAVNTNWPWGVVLFLFWLPINIQFATFSLLVLYYAQVVNRRKWESNRRKFVMIYGGTNIGLILLLIAGIVLEVTSSYEASLSNEVHTVFSASLSFILIVVLAGYTVQLMRLSRGDHMGKVSFQLSPSPLQVVLATFTIVVIFASRCVIDIVSSTDPDSDINTSFVVMRTHSRIVDSTAFSLYILWEVVPTLLVIFLFRSVPSTPRQQDMVYTEATQYMVNSTASDLRQPMVSKPTAISGKGGYFENDLRYDSDDDRGLDSYHNPILRPSPTTSVMSGTPVAGSLGPPPYMYSIPYAGSPAGPVESPWAAFMPGSQRTPGSARHGSLTRSSGPRSALPPTSGGGIGQPSQLARQSSGADPRLSRSMETGSPVADEAIEAASRPPPLSTNTTRHYQEGPPTGGSGRRRESAGSLSSRPPRPRRRDSEGTANVGASGTTDRPRRESVGSRGSRRDSEDSGPPQMS